MKVISVNIAKRQEITWQGRTWETGIFKKEVPHAIHLGKTDVKEDVVVNRKHHGGNNKAVYAFSKEHYAFFSKQFPDITLYHGIFGENLTLNSFDETTIHIGDIFTIGNAIIQVSQPRLPCKTLNAVFQSNEMMKLFLNSGFSGAYFRVIQEGSVQKGDALILKEKAIDSMTIYDINSLFTSNKTNQKLIEKALNLKNLSPRLKKDIQRKLQ